MRDYPFKRTYAVLRCPECGIEVDTYSEFIGAWCGQCGSPMTITGEKSWTVSNAMNGRHPDPPNPLPSPAERRRFLTAYKQAQGCVDCGTRDGQLQFDHKPGQPKGFVIAQGIERPWPELVTEVARCVVRCASCHARHLNARGMNGRFAASVSGATTAGGSAVPE